MSIFLIIFIILTAIIVLLTIIGLTLPREIRIEESRTMSGDSEVFFREICDLEKFVIWSPWTSKDPTMQMTFSGEKMTPGSKYEWKGNNKVGQGSMELTHIEVNRKVVFELTFGNRPASQAGFIIEPGEVETKVTWYLETDMGPNPIARTMGPVMKKFISKDFQIGLENLENHVKNL